jgi:hypothetical protein
MFYFSCFDAFSIADKTTHLRRLDCRATRHSLRWKTLQAGTGTQCPVWLDVSFCTSGPNFSHTSRVSLRWRRLRQGKLDTPKPLLNNSK